jgi:hypothetical protein
MASERPVIWDLRLAVCNRRKTQTYITHNRSFLESEVSERAGPKLAGRIHAGIRYSAM